MKCLTTAGGPGFSKDEDEDDDEDEKNQTGGMII
jgi:hypothetical protein